MDLRCANGDKFGELLDGRFLEVRCRNRRCGYRAGVVVVHRFDITTGKEVQGSPHVYRAAEQAGGQ
jgi:hypothetical protein